MIPQVNATARDIKFDFQNSCNCCDSACDEDLPVYVTSQGTVERFDPKKAQDEREALKRSICHLRTLIEQREELFPSRSVSMEKTLSDSVGEIREDSPRHMTKGELKKIKRLLESPLFNSREIEKAMTKRNDD